LGHAEVLALAVMAHAVTPGLPILCQNTPSVADMRTMASTTGGPETGLIRQIGTMVAQYLGIPACAHGHTSSARLDVQAADEKALNALMIASARPALLGGLGALANVTLTSYETMLLDDERNQAILRMLDGARVDDDHLAYDVLVELVESGTVMSHDHTLRYLHSDEVWQPDLAARSGLVGGAAPAESSVDRARARARELLRGHQVPSLPESVQDEIDAIMVAYGAGQARARR
jgi:trimethylamine--corrinoid protein Co-methyltransferase